MVSRNWDAVKIPLGGAVIEGIDVWRRAGHHPLGIDPLRSRQMGNFLIGTKSSFGDSWEGLARC